MHGRTVNGAGRLRRGATNVGFRTIIHPSRMSEALVPPLISVILPVLNGEPWLVDQLRALAVQECAVPWEVLIADNGSTDGSKEVAQAWADRHEGFHALDASAIKGAPAARNAGVRAAKGDLLAFCDADDVVYEGWLAGCLAALDEADVVAGTFDFWSLNDGPPSSPKPAASRQLGFLPAGLCANLAVRRTAFEQIGGFAEELLVGEDVELCWHLQLRGFRFAIAPNAIVAKRERSTSKQVFRQSLTYGRSGPVLFQRYRSAGAHRDLAGAMKTWVWLAASLPMLHDPQRRKIWARAAGVRLGRLEASVRERVLFP